MLPAALYLMGNYKTKRNPTPKLLREEAFKFVLIRNCSCLKLLVCDLVLEMVY